MPDPGILPLRSLLELPFAPGESAKPLLLSLRKILLTCGRKHIIEVTNVPIYKGDAMSYTLYHQLLLIQANPIQDFSLGKYLIQHCPIIQLSKVKPPRPLNVYSREPSFRRKMIANPIHFYHQCPPAMKPSMRVWAKRPKNTWDKFHRRVCNRSGTWRPTTYPGWRF